MSTETDRVRIATALGWILTNSIETRREYQTWIPPGQKPPVKGCFYNAKPADFETDANAALQICDFMRVKCFNFQAFNGLEKPWECGFVHWTNGTWHAGKAETLPAAICAAFLNYLDSETASQ